MERLTSVESYVCASLVALYLLCFAVRFQGRHKDVCWLFVMMNGTAILFFFLQQSTLLNLPSILFSLTMFFTLVSFPVGYKLVGVFLRDRPTHSQSIRAMRMKLSSKKMLVCNRVGYVFYFLAFSVELSNASWILPLFAENQLTAYYDFPMHFVHYLVVASIPISIVYAYLTFFRSGTTKIDHVVLFSMLILNTLILARAIVMTQVFLIGYFWFISNNYRIRTKLLIVLAVLLLSFITILGYYRTGDTLRVLLDIGGLSHWPDWAVPFAWPYLYFATSIENFRHIFESTQLDDLDVVTVGTRYVLIYLFTLIQAKDLIPGGEVVTSAGGFNTFGMYLNAFYDYYVFFPLSFLMIGVIVALTERTKMISVQLFFPYIVYCIFTSPVNDYLGQFFTLIYFVYIQILVLASRVKRSCS